jgi:hypothetical protein
MSWRSRPTFACTTKTCPGSASSWPATTASLPDGKVLVTGGFDTEDPDSAKLYDQSTGTWTATGSMIDAWHFFTAPCWTARYWRRAGALNEVGVASAELYVGGAT